MSTLGVFTGWGSATYQEQTKGWRGSLGTQMLFLWESFGADSFWNYRVSTVLTTGTFSSLDCSQMNASDFLSQRGQQGAQLQFVPTKNSLPLTWQPWRSLRAPGLCPGSPHSGAVGSEPRNSRPRAAWTAVDYEGGRRGRAASDPPLNHHTAPWAPLNPERTSLVQLRWDRQRCRGLPGGPVRTCPTDMKHRR